MNNRTGRWISISMLTTLMSTALIGCGVPVVREPQVVAPLVNTDPTTSIKGFDQSRSFPVRIYFLRNGRFDFLERRDNAETDPTIAVRNALANLEQGGLSRSERDQGYSSPIDAILTDAAFNVDISVTNGVAEVDITESAGLLRSLSQESRDEVFGQVALTVLLATPGIGALQFVAGGSTLEAKTGAGPTMLLHVGDFACVSKTSPCNLPMVMLPPPPVAPDSEPDSEAVVGPTPAALTTTTQPAQQ